MGKSKAEQRKEAIKRLKEHVDHLSYYSKLIRAIVGDDFYELTGNECIGRIVDLLTDDERLAESDYIELLRDAAVDYYLAVTSGDRWNHLCNEFEEAYITLPMDADGVPIHVGDEMERGTKRGRVVALMLSNYPQKWGGGLHWGVQLEGEQAPTALDSLFHHYHKPTVEDVLREFGDEVRRCCDTEDTIAEYAKKLRLKEDDDEA